MQQLRLWNGPNVSEPSVEALAALVRDAPAGWDSRVLFLERGERQASLRWVAPDTDGAIGIGLLFTIDGESPLGEESPELRMATDEHGGRARIASRHLVDAHRAQVLVAHFARHGDRLRAWEDGAAVQWEASIVDEAPWQAVGSLEPLTASDLYVDNLVTLAYGPPPTAEGPDAESGNEDELALPEGERGWVGQVGLFLTPTPLADAAAHELPRTALWPVVRTLHSVTDARWLSLLVVRPMPWLRSLVVETSALEALGEVVARAPRLVELAIHGRPASLPPLASMTLSSLVLDIADGSLIETVLAAASLPALRVLVLFGDALAQRISLPSLDPRTVVMLPLRAHGHAADFVTNVVTPARVVGTDW